VSNRVQVDSPRIVLGSDADRQVEIAGGQQLEQRRRRGNPEVELQIGVGGPKATERFRVVVDGGSVDHADPDGPLVGRSGPFGPTGQIAGQGQNLAGVIEQRLSGRPQRPTSPVPLEDGQTDTSFQFGHALGQR
jgi:hypothetical protein